MKKCIYRSESDSKCCRSTSDKHCQIVTNDICGKCILHQVETIVSDKTRFKSIIRESIKLLKQGDTKEAMRILNAAMKIQ